MGGWNGPILNESAGIPGDLAGPMRKRGLIPALMQTQPAQPAGTDRVQDDPVTRANPEAYGATTPAQSPVSASPSNPLTDKMWEEYNRLGQPEPAPPQPTLKQRLLQGILRAAPIAAGAAFGGAYGAEGAAQGEVQGLQNQQRVRLAQQQMAQQHQQQRDSLRERMLQEILQQQRMAQQNQQFEERETQRDTLAKQAQDAAAAKQQAAFGQQKEMEGQREAARAQAQKETESAREASQARQFDQQNKLERDRFAQQMAMQGRQFAEQEKLVGMRKDTEKATADEQRRADLANNMTRNLDELEDIVKRRPELFGRMGGRMTRLEQWDNPLNPFAGTKDPDVAKLKAIREYLGMASVGTHAMRNAQHVGAAADAVMGSFMNSPQATMGAIQDARNSIETFKQDVLNKGGMVGGVQGTRGGGRPTSQPIVQRSKSTGAYRYSMDGGQTWQQGQPPSR